MDGKTRILLADDHTVLREGMRVLLDREEDLEVVAEAGDGEDAIRLAAQFRPDVVVMDIVMPGLTGIEATRRIKEMLPSTVVLVLTAHDDDRYVLGLLEAGAAGYLLKSSRVSELARAIRTIRDGESVLLPADTARLMARAVASAEGLDWAKIADQLTERELEILGLAARGLGNKEIAQQLSLSLPTVKAHLANVFNKMGVGSRTEAALQAVRKGWIQS